MKVIFLDFDGVLNSRAYLSSGRHPVNMHCGMGLDPYAVARVAMIMSETDSSVVVTSAWRTGRSLDVLTGLLSAGGVWIVPFDKVPKGNSRAEEIRAWLLGRDVESFVILDDEDCYADTELNRRLVLTSFNDGLTDEKMNEAIAMLKAGAK